MRSRNMRRTGYNIVVLVVATCLLCLARPTLCGDVGADNNSNKAAAAAAVAGEAGQKPINKPHDDKSEVVENNPKSHVEKPTDDNKHTDTAAAAAAAAAAAVVDTNAKQPGIAEVKVTSNSQSPPAAVKVVKPVADNEQTSQAPEPPGIGHAASLNPGALLRGFYVFVGLSVLAVAYIVFRSFRLNKSRTQMVRKYGVLAHKQDIEMRPLPLDEDDEDDTTVFDASGLSPPPRLQS